ncbi:MAG: type II toxin-antitoxin system VapC family toxin [Spirochaetales bacterium]|nr:type II toxin-antitoxin system VapC family toxin [Spirochaetales bacterium]
MNARYLLDTNIISEPLRAVPDQRVIDNMKINEGKTVLCSPVLHELRYGMERLPESKKKALIRAYIDTVIMPSLPILPYASEAAVIHAGLRAKLEAKGQTTGYVDSQIASIAMVNNLTLVTRNIKDFENIEGLKVEDWFS